jgi:protein gp37
MGKQGDKGISWAEYTFNPWWSCEKVSPACQHCYAEAWAKRCGYDVFGAGKPARLLSDHYWNEPYRWDRDAKKLGTRYRVFCGSMCDIFQERDDVNAEREKLWKMIEETPNLTWMLLTKRPENADRIIVPRWSHYWPRNVWAGVTVENQEQAERRIPYLLRLNAAVRFLSCEPLLGKVELTYSRFCKTMKWGPPNPPRWQESNRSREETFRGEVRWLLGPDAGKINFIVVGGESGAKARTCNIDGITSIVRQCRSAGIPVHVKQLGENPVGKMPLNPPVRNLWHTEENLYHYEFSDRKAKNMAEWPEDLRVREMPQ